MLTRALQHRDVRDFGWVSLKVCKNLGESHQKYNGNVKESEKKKLTSKLVSKRGNQLKKKSVSVSRVLQVADSVKASMIYRLRALGRKVLN